MEMMSKQYPEIEIILIGRKEYRELCQKYNFIVDNWEFTRWDKDEYVWKYEN
jgi:hypothetical protein